MKPKISVVIPVYNGAIFLPRCLKSLQNQTLHDWNAIFIDDGSTDNSGKILDNFAKQDSRIIVIHKKNAGVSAARNDGIKKANGIYIHFMDVDDIIDKNYYEVMFNTANGFDIIASGFVSNSKHSSNLVYKHNHTITSLFGKLFWSQAIVKSFVWRYLFKTEFIKKNKLCFDTSLISQEDAIFVLKAMEFSGDIIIVSGVNYHYLFNNNSALNKKSSEHHKTLKMQYKIGKQFRRQYAKNNNVTLLWYLRKIIRLFF